MAMLFCAVAAITVTSMADVFMSVVAADSIVSIVIAIRSVMDGDYMNALVYGAFAVAGIIGVCKWYNVNYQIDYVGEKGIARFAGWKNGETNTASPYEFVRTHPQIKGRNKMSDFVKEIYNDGGIKETIKYVEHDGHKYIVDGHHRVIVARN